MTSHSRQQLGSLDTKPAIPETSDFRVRSEGTFRMFPGESSDDFQRGASHLELLNGIASASAEANEQLQNGCVTRFDTWYYENDDTNPVEALVNPPPSEMVVAFVSHGDETTRWRAYRYDSAEPEYRIIDSKTLPVEECPSSDRSYVLNSTHFVGIFQDISFEYQPPLHFQYEFHKEPPGNRTGPADWFAMEMVPPYVDLEQGSVGYLPYRYVMSATTGLVEYMYIDPRDADDLQPGP